MAFQVNPKEAHVPEDEWKVGVAAYENGQDPEAAIAKYRGEKAAEVTAAMEASKQSEVEEPDVDEEDPTPEIPSEEDADEILPPSPVRATTRRRVVK